MVDHRTLTDCHIQRLRLLRTLIIGQVALWKTLGLESSDVRSGQSGNDAHYIARPNVLPLNADLGALSKSASRVIHNADAGLLDDTSSPAKWSMLRFSF